MENNNREELFDALVKAAAKEVMRQEIEALPPPEELNKLYQPSPEFDR